MSKKATLYFDLHCKCGFKYIFHYKKDVVNFQKKNWASYSRWEGSVCMYRGLDLSFLLSEVFTVSETFLKRKYNV